MHSLAMLGVKIIQTITPYQLYTSVIWRNLISLRIFDSDGWRISVESGVMKIVKGSRVTMKGVKENGFYVMLGNTVVGYVANVSNFQIDKMKLWHLRLPHVSETGLKKLSEHGCFWEWSYWYSVIVRIGFCDRLVRLDFQRLMFIEPQNI